MSHDFYWTNRKRNVERLLPYGLRLRLQLNSDVQPPELQAAVHGEDKAGRPYTTAWHEISVLLQGIEKWADGELIQNAMPSVSKGDREFIKTGSSPRDWADAFGEDD
jgi:hypothetical protein